MGIMNLFGLLNRKSAAPTRQEIRAADRQAEADKAQATTTIPASSAAAPAPNPARRLRLMSCRERKAGHVDASGRFQSPFDIWLLRQHGMRIPEIRRVFGRAGAQWACQGT